MSAITQGASQASFTGTVSQKPYSKVYKKRKIDEVVFQEAVGQTNVKSAEPVKAIPVKVTTNTAASSSAATATESEDAINSLIQIMDKANLQDKFIDTLLESLTAS